ncbi:unnamed protein product, partial [Dovyalis caffra]
SNQAKKTARTDEDNIVKLDTATQTRIGINYVINFASALPRPIIHDQQGPKVLVLKEIEGRWTFQ